MPSSSSGNGRNVVRVVLRVRKPVDLSRFPFPFRRELIREDPTLHHPVIKRDNDDDHDEISIQSFSNRIKRHVILPIKRITDLSQIPFRIRRQIIINGVKRIKRRRNHHATAPSWLDSHHPAPAKSAESSHRAAKESTSSSSTASRPSLSTQYSQRSNDVNAVLVKSNEPQAAVITNIAQTSSSSTTSRRPSRSTQPHQVGNENHNKKEKEQSSSSPSSSSSPTEKRRRGRPRKIQANHHPSSEDWTPITKRVVVSSSSDQLKEPTVSPKRQATLMGNEPTSKLSNKPKPTITYLNDGASPSPSSSGMTSFTVWKESRLQVRPQPVPTTPGPMKTLPASRIEPTSTIRTTTTVNGPPSENGAKSNSSPHDEKSELYSRDVQVSSNPAGSLNKSTQFVAFLQTESPLFVRNRILIELLTGHDRAQLVACCRDLLNLLQGAPYDEFSMIDLAKALETRDRCLWKFGRTRLVLLDVDSTMRWLPVRYPGFMSTIRDVIVDEPFGKIESFAGFEKFVNACRLTINVRSLPSDFEVVKGMKNLEVVDAVIGGINGEMADRIPPPARLLSSPRNSNTALPPLTTRRFSSGSTSSSACFLENLLFSTDAFETLAEMVRNGNLRELSWRPFCSEEMAVKVDPDNQVFWIKPVFEDIDWTGLRTLHLHLSTVCDFNAIDSGHLLPALPLSLERLVIHDLDSVGSKFNERHRAMIQRFVRSRGKMIEVIEL